MRLPQRPQRPVGRRGKILQRLSYISIAGLLILQVWNSIPLNNDLDDEALNPPFIRYDAIQNDLLDVVQYQKCMLELEQIMHPLIWKYREERLPIPVSVRIIKNRFYILVLINHVQHLDQALRDAATEIHCNDSGGGTVVGRRLKGKMNDMIVVECPASVGPTDSTLSQLTILLPPNNGNKTFTYTNTVIGKMDECERLDISQMKRTRPAATTTQHDKRNVRIGAAIAFRNYLQPWSTNEWRGSQVTNMRDQAMEWAEYHHLLGVDHLWIYVNEAWANGTSLHHRDYITWVPYDWNMYNYRNFSRFPGDTTYFEIFRIASQTDAVWRARREGMDWIVLNDIDEYVRIGPPADAICPEGRCGYVDSLSRFMRNFTDLNASGIASRYKQEGGALMGGIRFESVYYGRNVEKDSDNINLVVDNTWTKKRGANYTKSEFAKQHRRKMIVDPNIVVSTYIHDITSTSLLKPFSCCGGLIEIDEDVIRVNHYKQPYTGVQMNERKSHQGESQLAFLLKLFRMLFCWCSIAHFTNVVTTIGNRRVMTKQKTQNKTHI